MNPKEKIENDKRLTAILNGLRSLWQYSDDFLSIVLWHTDDYDKANIVIEEYMSTDEIPLEEILFKILGKEEFKNKCLNSEFLDYKKCKELVDSYDEEE